MPKKMFKRLIIQKPDLDTSLTALIMNVAKGDNIHIRNTEADEEELNDSEILCIEAGGSGLTELNNFDHHEPNRYFPPACKQAYMHMNLNDEKLFRLVQYVCMVDERIKIDNSIEFPSLSNIFSGMLLVENDRHKQFIKGMEILKTVLDNSIDPFGTMPDTKDWQDYKTAKMNNHEMLQESFNNLEIFRSHKGTSIGFLKATAIGGIEFIYSQNCDVAILFNPSFGNPPIPKYTIAGNNKKVSHLLNLLNSIEPAWGGRETIIGSPRTGTNLSPEALIQIAINNL